MSLLYKVCEQFLFIYLFRNAELSQDVLLLTHTKITYSTDSSRGVRLIYSCLEVENEWYNRLAWAR